MKSKAAAFLFKITLFVLPVLIFFEVIFRLGFYPIMTTSTTYDMKMRQVRNQHIRNVKLLAIGSSVGLYGLNSSIIAHNLNSSYYNFASWGLQMADISDMLKDYADEYNPQYVMICSSFADFTMPKNESYNNYLNVNSHIRNNFPEVFYFKKYYSIHQIIRRKFKTYPVLLDEWGGSCVPTNAKGKNKVQFVLHNVFPTKYTGMNYNYLDTLSDFLQSGHIKLIFIQAPIRKDCAGTTAQQQVITTYFNQCKSIVEAHGGTYLNYYDNHVFADSLFIDQYHLKSAGSVVLTNEIVRDLKGIVK